LGHDFTAVAPRATALLVQRALLCSHPDLAGRVDQVLAAKVEEGKAGCLQAATIEWPTDAVVESVRKETASVLEDHATIWSLYQRLRPVCAGLQGARFQFIWSHLVQGKDVQGKPGGPKLDDLNQATQGLLGLTLKRELGKSIIAVFGKYTDNEPSPKIPPENRELTQEEWEKSRKAFGDYNLRLAAEKPPVPGYQSRRFRDSAGKGLEYRKVQMVLGDPPVGWREFAEALGQVTEPWAAPAQ
jgi:hypothetical protein